MKIGVNGYEAVVPRFGYSHDGLPNRVGSSEVCFEILSELEKIDKKNEYTIYLPVAPTADMPKTRDGWIYKVVPGRRLWTLRALNRAVNQDRPDVFWSPTHYAPLMLKMPQIITILDVSYKHFPKMFAKRDLYKLSIWGKYSVKRAKRIITISQTSRDDIIKEYNVAPTKVAVVTVGIRDIIKSDMKKEDVLEKHSVSTPYILFVGTIQPRKNIVRLIEAFSRIKKARDSDLALVVIGRRGWQFKETFEAPNKYGVGDSVKFLENVTDEELPVFYKNAELFVLPSLYEGFGLPILEAMQYGAPVATSNVSSLPEAGGDAAAYFDPTDAEDMVKVIENVLDHKSLREKMVERGKKHVKEFSWEKSAVDVLKVLEEVAHA